MLGHITNNQRFHVRDEAIEESSLGTVTQLKQNLTDYLSGAFIRNRPDNLALLRDYPDWQRMAQLLLDQRATQVLNGLPDAELRAIAQGNVNINDMARHWNA